ncbi:hypothetical protein C1J03_23545 (plasmid) [Sulfitobacter sp. SK012]|nr:hypothetical protein C1J03_23545 [Sulfitobacter sp. SK012]
MDIGNWLTGFAASTAGVVGNIGLILLYVAFMLGERSAFTKKLPRLCATPDSAGEVEEILRSISAGVRQYVWINTATSAMSGTLAFVVMTALGVDFAFPLALLVFCSISFRASDHSSPSFSLRLWLFFSSKLSYRL